MEPTEIGTAKDDQRDPARDMGTDQSVVLSGARQAKLEEGAVVRLESTVTAALMHEPSDSSLLWDAAWCAC